MSDTRKLFTVRDIAGWRSLTCNLCGWKRQSRQAAVAHAKAHVRSRSAKVDPAMQMAPVEDRYVIVEEDSDA
jgi:hypothetical protein